MAKFLKMLAIAAVAVASVTASGQVALATGPKGPPGWQILCFKQPGECVGGGMSSIAATSDTISELQRVNLSVNRSIRPQEDPGLDVWSVNVSVGDCEDFALTKRHRLIEAGLPASSLRIAQVTTRRGAYHAILVVKTNKGSFVLDNLSSSIKPLSQTPYRVVSMQTANPRLWS